MSEYAAEPVNIAIIGTGYVGLVTGVCLANAGHKVICVDKDRRRISNLRKGIIPIVEQGLAEMLATSVQAGNLAFSCDTASSVRGADAIFIAVGTPSRGADGEADLTCVYMAVRKVAASMRLGAVVVVKSTVPVGTGDELAELIKASTGAPCPAVASNPEFLREGRAIADFQRPDRIVAGIEEPGAEAVLRRIYSPFIEAGAPFFVTERRTAELIKYAANAFLAMKIAYINEMADLCEVVGADVRDLAAGIGLDPRIGREFLAPGPGYGGSCFPKDTRALARSASQAGVRLRLVEQTIQSNEVRKLKVLQTVIAACDGPLQEMTIAVLGLSFKAGTDDVRDSPALCLAEALAQHGAKLRVHDPAAMPASMSRLPRAFFAQTAMECAAGADVVVIATEWREYRSLDWLAVKRAMCGNTIVDLRNVIDPDLALRFGFRISAIGQPLMMPEAAPKAEVVAAVAGLAWLAGAEIEDVRASGA